MDSGSTLPPPSDPAHSPPWSERAWVHGLAIALLALTINLLGNGRSSLWDRDEPRYAGCAREMRATGDYIHPHFNAEPRYHKPILTYWLMQIGVAIGGDNPFGNRLISALAGVGTCLVIWRLGSRMLGARAGLWAALALATAPLVAAESKLATTDSILFFFMALSWRALWELRSARNARWAAVFWSALALAVLTKGPVAPIFLLAGAIVDRLWSGPNSAWKNLHWRWGVPLFLAIAAPWYIAIGIVSGGEFFEVAMGRHVIHRMTTDMETHGGFPGFYIVGTIGGMFPWSALLPPALWHAWKQRRVLTALGFIVGWWLGPLIFLEIIRTKLIHYFLPATAGAALLVGWFIEELAASESSLRRWPLGRLSVGSLVGVGITAAATLAAAAFVLPEPMRAPCAIGAALLVVGTLVAAERFTRGAPRPGALALAATWALLLAVVGGWALPAAEPYRLTPQVAAQLRKLCDQYDAEPMLATFQPPGVVYNFGRPIPVREDDDWLTNYVRSSERVVVALTPKELRMFQVDPDLDVELLGDVHGLNIERARNEKMNFALLRPRVPQQQLSAGGDPVRR